MFMFKAAGVKRIDLIFGIGLAVVRQIGIQPE